MLNARIYAAYVIAEVFSMLAATSVSPQRVPENQNLVFGLHRSAWALPSGVNKWLMMIYNVFQKDFSYY